MLPRLVLTSPNTDWIPFVYFPQVVICVRRDGRYGSADWTLWPQLFCEDFAHRAFCPRKASLAASDERRVLWDVPSHSDFVLSEGPVIFKPALGKLTPRKVKTLVALYETLTSRVRKFQQANPTLRQVDTYHNGLLHVVNRLRFHESTFHEILALTGEFARCFLDCQAFMDWHEKFRTNMFPQVERQECSGLVTHNEVMGAWTADPTAVARLFYVVMPQFGSEPRFEPELL